MSRKILSLTLFACAACAHQAPIVAPPPAVDAAPRAALVSFLAAQKAGDFQAMYSDLCGKLRARYTPERLRSDFMRDEALAQDKLARIRAVLHAGTSMHVQGARAELPLAAGLAVHLVQESGAWRIASLE